MNSEDRAKKQREEFDALDKMYEKYRALCLTLVTNSSFESVRRDYDFALDAFLRACARNGRYAG